MAEGSLLEKCNFDPFLTHFLSQSGPFSRQYAIFHGPKRVTTGLKDLFEHAKWFGNNFGKNDTFAIGTLVDPPLAPTVRGPRCPPAPPCDHSYGGLGVSLGDSEAWKPQKVGGCRWTRCPLILVLSRVGQDTAHSWFRAYLTQMGHV